MATRLGVHVSGSGPLLLLLHGIGSSRTAWGKQIERLQDSFTCIAPDMPGYGDSDDIAEPGLDAIVSDIAALLGSRSAHVVGVSFGALTALALARRHPAFVTSLVLSDATLGRAKLAGAERERWLRMREDLAATLAERSLERAAEIASPRASKEVVEEIATHMRRARAAGYRAVAAAIAETDAEPWLAQILQPTLVVCGEDDGVTGLAQSVTLADKLPNARLVKIAAAGHAPHIEQPDLFAQAVRGFLQCEETRAGLDCGSSPQ